MDFNLDERRTALLDRVRELCAEELSEERESEMDATGVFPADLYARLAEYGLFGIPFADEYGGQGGDILDVVLAVEVLGMHSNTAVNMFLVPVIFGGMIVLLCGNDAQRGELLPRLIAGKLKFSFSLTEPQAGSDVRSILTSATRSGDGYKISGTKYWTTGATVADLLIVVGLTDTEGDPSHGMTVFLVDAAAEGLTVTPIPKLAGSAFPSCEVVLDEVFVPEDMVLGGQAAVGGGWGQLLATADLERICIAATCVGGAAQILDECAAYSKERVQFNRPIFKFQAIQHRLAEMATRIEAMRWMTYHAAWLKSQNMSCFKEICMAKLFCSESLLDISRQGMGMMGGMGYSLEGAMQRHLRESYLSIYAGGTSDIQKNIISRLL